MTSLRPLIVCIITLFFTSCTQTGLFDHANLMQDEGDHLSAVIEYRKLLRQSPRDTELRSRLQQAERQAADHYLSKGQEAFVNGNYTGAIYHFEHGLLANPKDLRLKEQRMTALQQKEAERLIQVAERHMQSGDYKYARQFLKKATDYAPEHPKLVALLQRANQGTKNTEQRYIVEAMSSGELISLNFKETELRKTLLFISRPFEINFMFDQEVSNAPITLNAENITFKQALNMILGASKCFYKIVGPNTILIAPDTSSKRGEYADYYMRIFHLKVVSAKTMAEILRSSLNITSVVVNESLNTIQIRDTKERLKLAERIIHANDRKPAEIMLGVEILEVNRTKSEQLGLDYGSQITAQFPQFTFNEAFSALFASAVLGEGTVTLPNIAFKYFKQDVDAKILANPRVRALDNKEAKLHIGDRVPLRSSTIQDATGQTRTTFEYRDIGIRLNVIPKYHLDNTITVDLNLEVSSLGQNLGTSNEPAFSIGTRNVNTTMNLREGETAILGGLIRDEDRKSLTKLPGIGEIPTIGRAFAVNDDQVGRTDILLTITPTIVRGQSLPKHSDTEFYSGTEKQNSLSRPFEYLENGFKTRKPARISQKYAAHEAGKNGYKPSYKTKRNTLSGQNLGFAFSQSLYSTKEGEQVTVTLKGQNLTQLPKGSFRILFNASFLKFISGTPAGGSAITNIRQGTKAGSVTFDYQGNGARGNGEQELLTLTFETKRQGLSYLLMNTLSPLVGRNGQDLDATYQSSKIAIQ